MQIFETITIPERKEKVLKFRRCDICGKKSEQKDWTDNVYEIDETKISVKIKQKQGESYPEGGSGTEIEVDLCPICFKFKLIPWLLSQGATIQKKNWEW